MATVSTSTDCPNCGADVDDIEGDVLFDTQYHPYGSTSVPEDITEIEGPAEVTCDECGYKLTAEEIDRVQERLIDLAREQAAEGAL